MMIYTKQFHRSAIDQQFIIFRNLYFSQSRLQVDHFSGSFQLYLIQIRLFCIPENRIFRSITILILNKSFCQEFLSVKNTDLCFTLDFYTDSSIIWDHFNIHQMTNRSLKQITVSEDTVESEEVLIFQITAAAPFQNFHTDGVLSFVYCICNIKFRLQMTSLGKTDIFIIHI